MGEFLSYSIVSGIAMLAMFLAYRLFLARENQHSYNRCILLLIYIVSFTVYPVATITGDSPAQTGTDTTVLGGVVFMNPEISDVSNPLWGSVLIWIFIVGMAVVAVKTVVTWMRLVMVIRSGERIRRDGCILVLTDDERFAPFSWAKYIVISRRDYADNYFVIAAHELKHIESRHWIDLLIAQIVCIINWFNPASWLMRDELMLVHEYQADMAVIDSGYAPKQYQLLLIKKAVGARFPSLANSLNHSKLKKRITMMYKQKSGAGSKIKALALVPMLALALGVATVPAVRAAVSTISSSDVSVDKSSENPASDKIPVKGFSVKNLNNSDGKTTITIKGEGLGDHLTVSGGTFTTMGKTYQANTLQCNMTDGEAIVTATFPFTDSYENSSMTLTVNGKELLFNLEDFFNNSAVVVSQPDVMPQYPGGESAMMQAIMSNISFPDPDRKWKDGSGGQTVVSFTVFPDGTTGNFERKQSCGYGDLDQIAINTVKESFKVKWIPGTVDGKPVSVICQVPIRFKSQGDTKK